MDGQNRLGSRRDGLFDEGRIEHVGLGVDVDVDGLCADVADRPGGADPGVGRGNDFVAGADIAGVEGQLQGGGAVVQADAVVDADVFGEGSFKAFDGRTEDELRARDHPLEGRLPGRRDATVLLVQIEKRHG